MFGKATFSNQDISYWGVLFGTTFDSMLQEVTSFNQDISDCVGENVCKYAIVPYSMNRRIIIVLLYFCRQMGLRITCYLMQVNFIRIFPRGHNPQEM